MPIRTFLSYARGDDEPFVRRLYEDLAKAGFKVWFDRESLLSRGLTFHQEIRDAIRTEVDRIIYVAGPKAALSAYCREEWQTGMQFDHIVVTPILRLGEYSQIPGELGLLHCEDFRDDSKYVAALAKLITGLRHPNPKLGALFGVPSLPPNFLTRPDFMGRVRDALLVDLQTTQVITSCDARVGVQGMGGIGKSVLAAALARNRQVREAYPDGVVWISFGQNLLREDLLSRLSDLIRYLKREASVTSLPQGQSLLHELSQDKALLLILDDVWRASDAKEFDFLGPRCRMLITTRDAGILHTLRGELVPVSLFTENEALQLLADAVGISPSMLPPKAHAVAKECGWLPLAIALSGGMAKKRGGDFHAVLEHLRQANLEKIADRESINEQHRNIWRAMQASVDMLTEEEKSRFAELAVFPEDELVPEAAVATFWEYSGGLDALETDELLISLSERSLIQLDIEKDARGEVYRRIGLHDLLHDYAVRIAGETKALHRRLLESYRQKCPQGWGGAPDDDYVFQHLRHHLVISQDWDELCACLTDFRFLERRIRGGAWVESSIHDVVRDMAAAMAALPEFSEEVRREKERTNICAEYAVALASYGLRRRQGQNPLLPTPPFAGRVSKTKERPKTQSRRAARLKAVADFLTQHATLIFSHSGDFLTRAANAARNGPLNDAAKMLDEDGAPWLQRFPRPPAPGLRPQCLAILDAHSDTVESVKLTSDGRRAISAAGGRSLWLWDLDSGERESFPEGHSGRLANLTPAGRYAVATGYGDVLRLWDVKSRQCLITLKGPREWAGALSITPDGKQVVSADGDAIQIWNLEGGQCQATLRGHTDSITSVDLTADGKRAVSGSQDKTIRLWDLDSGQCLATLRGHKSTVTSVSITPDGRRALSGSDDKTLRYWDLESRQCLTVLRGHRFSVTSVCLTPDGRRGLSGSGDGTLRLWDLEGARRLTTLRGHQGGVTSVSMTPDARRALSGSYDQTARVWDLESDQRLTTLKGHEGEVTSLQLTLDGARVLSAGSDYTLRLWDLARGKCLAVLRGHTSWITSVLLAPDGRRAISASEDKTLRIWDMKTHQCTATLEGHSSWITSASLTANGRRVISASEDKTLRLWDLDTRKCLATLEGHTNMVMPVICTPDGRRAVSASEDKTLRVWDLDTGRCLAILQGHTDWIGKISLTPDGKRVISTGNDHTLRVWDLKSGRCLAILEGHTNAVRNLNITPDGKHAVSGSADHTLRIWNLATWQSLPPLEGHREEVNIVKLTPDGRRIISASHRGEEIKVWDVATGRCLATLDDHFSWINEVSLTTNGKRAVSFDGSETLCLWDLDTYRCLASYYADGRISCATASADGNQIVCGTDDGQMHFLTLRNPPST